MKHNTPAQEAKSLGTLFSPFQNRSVHLRRRLRHDRPAGRRVHPAPQMAGQRRIPRHDRHRGIHPRTGGHQQRHLPRLQAGQSPRRGHGHRGCLPAVLPHHLRHLAVFEQFTQLTVIANAFKGIQVCVIYLIFSAGVRMLKALDKSPFATGLLAAVMLVMVGLSLAGVSVSSILLILLSGAAGVAAWLIGRRKEGK